MRQLVHEGGLAIVDAVVTANLRERLDANGAAHTTGLAGLTAFLFAVHSTLPQLVLIPSRPAQNIAASVMHYRSD